MCSTQGIQTSLWMGCPIRNLKAHRSYAAPLERFAGLRVLHRLGVPRHPPRTLSRLWLLSSLCGVAPLRDGCCFTHESPVACASASVSSLFALGKIEVIIHYLVVQCAPFLV